MLDINIACKFVCMCAYLDPCNKYIKAYLHNICHTIMRWGKTLKQRNGSRVVSVGQNDCYWFTATNIITAYIDKTSLPKTATRKNRLRMFHK